MPESDKTLPENSKENLDRKLDHAVEETFPTSDPVSVQITKGGAIDYDEKGQPVSGSSDQRSQCMSGSVVDQAKETVSDLAGSASEAARGAYEQGQRYVRQAAQRYPEAERYYREGTHVVRQRVAEYPLMTMLAGAATGYALAWLIYGSRSTGRKHTSYRPVTEGNRPGELTGKPLIESDRVEGTIVYDLHGKGIGAIKRLMIEKLSGRVAYAVMSFGGFLGMGQDEHIIPWSKLNYDTSLGGYRTDITEDQLRGAPSFSRDRSHDWTERQREQDLHDYYGARYYWDGMGFV